MWYYVLSTVCGYDDGRGERGAGVMGAVAVSDKQLLWEYDDYDSWGDDNHTIDKTHTSV